MSRLERKQTDRLPSQIPLSEKREVRHADLEKRKAKKQAEEERRSAAAKKRSIFIKKFFVITLLALLAIAIIFGRQIIRIYNLEQEKAAAQKRLEELQLQIDLLEDELARVSTPEYIESQARYLLRMIKPGEVLYVINDKK